MSSSRQNHRGIVPTCGGVGDHKYPIMATANDAIVSKLSTSQRGYYDDPFLPYMALSSPSKSSSTSSSDMSQPIHEGFQDSTQTPQHTSRKVQRRSFDDEEGYPQYHHPSHRAQGRFRTIDHRTQPYESHSHPIHARRQNKPRPTSNPWGAGVGIGPGARVGGNAGAVGGGRQQPQTQPVIRRGTHARVCVMDYAISAFFRLYSELLREKDKNVDGDTGMEGVQIVILGSGRDTTYLRSQCRLLHKRQCGTGRSGEQKRKVNARWYEVDHASVIRNKYDLLRSCDLFDFDCDTICDDHNTIEGHNASTSYNITPKTIRTMAKGQDGVVVKDQTPTHLDPYHLVSYDLTESFSALLQEHLIPNHGFDPQLPTLFLMECVQMYLPEQTSRHILQGIVNHCVMPLVAILDPIIGHRERDPFGQVMAQNLTRARIAHPSMSFFNTTTLEGHVDKLLKCTSGDDGDDYGKGNEDDHGRAPMQHGGDGFQYVTGCDFYQAYETILTDQDRRRASMTEMLDEVEEWMLIMKHYCFVVAAGVGNSSGTETKSDPSFASLAKSFCTVGPESILGFLENKCMHRTQEGSNHGI